jgi:hypothetical protein
MAESDLEKRVKRLENIHVYGGLLVLTGIIVYLTIRRKNDYIRNI